MRNKLFFWIALIVIFLPGCRGGAVSEMARVENGLTPGIFKAGGPRPAFNILDRMKHYNVPGVSLAVVNDGKIEWAKGYGILEAGTDRMVGPETLFQTGSVGKVIAAMTTLSLVHKGRLELDKDVRGYLRSWKIPENEYTRETPVTLRRLLSHTAGVGDDNSAPFHPGSPLPTLTEHLRRQNYEIIKTPGEGYFYSGAGFIIIEQIIEDVTGKPYAEIAEEEVLNPLGMNDTFLKQILPDSLLVRAALAHHQDGNLYADKYPVYPCYAPGTCNWSTASNMARLFLELAKSCDGESDRILPNSLTREMMTNLSPAYGLGLKVIKENGATFVGHSGDFYGFHACIYGYRDKGKGIAVMTNGDHGVLLYNEIIRSVAEAYDWPGCHPETESSAVIDGDRMATLCGCYFLPGKLDVMNVYLKDGKLCCDLLGDRGSELFPVTATRFYDPGSDGVIIFNAGPDGKIQDVEFRRIGVLLKGIPLPGFDLLYSDRFKEGVGIITSRKAEYEKKRYFGNVFNAIGYSLLAESWYQNAIAVFQLAVFIFPDSADLHDSLGEAYWRSGDKPSAVASYRRALELDPDLPSAIRALSELQR